VHAMRVATGRVRNWHLLVVDALGVAVASFLAVGFRNLESIVDPSRPWVLALVTIVVGIQLAVNVAAGLYRHDWRFASVTDMARIVAAVMTGTVIAGLFVLSFGLVDAERAGRVPLTFWPIELLLSLFVIGGTRFAIRAVFDLTAERREDGHVTGKPTLLYGAGRIGVVMARSAAWTPAAGVVPVGFLDDDPGLKGTRVAGLPVFGGIAALEQAVAETGAQALLITASNADGATIRRVVQAANEIQIDVRTVPSMVELLDGTIDAHRVRKVRVEDLLRRATATEHAPEVDEVFRGRTVLITGAGGSIGSELARQVMAVQPRRVILLDRAESALFDIHRQLSEAYGDSGIEIRQELANVASRATIGRIVATERPDVILHAAAYKHVPMMEQHPSDAIHVNVSGTMALLDAAVESGVGRFVLVSTDKAVRPSSIMGASKRVAEMLVADTARRTGLPFVSVRFGNVLGSNGSVVPIFTDQLERGRPLTITHPEMTRYFMTIPEASWLILDAAALGRAGDLFVLDMGKPVRILDLARDVARLAGRDPESQPMEIVGLRPGEKLHEELFYDREQVVPTSTPKVMRARAEEPPTDIRACVGRLLEFATGTHDADLRSELSRIVGGIQGPPEPPEAAPLGVVVEPRARLSEPVAVTAA
jgi:FlaA1/EpsC-like NDP-sugar epimerase